MLDNISQVNISQIKNSHYETVIGLEIHVQITSAKSKLFSSAATTSCANPNTNITLLDVGLPGTLPVLNEFCVRQAVMTGLALNGEINKSSFFERKQYFYPDTPLGYQISQQEEPIVKRANIIIDSDSGEKKTIRIKQIHLEQDAAKNIHDLDNYNSYIDFNRAGVPLMEIVTEPDIASPEEAARFIKKLISILECIEVCDCDMSKGNLRIDANVSVRKPGDPLGTRVEIKNLNSIKFMQMAVNLEVERHISMIESGETILMQTLLFDPDKMQTRVMRTKEIQDDYRYFPDPDLLPVILSEDYINNIRDSIPELPENKYNRFMKQFSLSHYDASIITENKEAALFFENAIALSKIENAKIMANILIGEIFSYINNDNITLSQSHMTANHLAEIVDKIDTEIISIASAKIVLKTVWSEGGNIDNIINELSLAQISSIEQIKTVIMDILKQEQNYVNEYRSGKTKLFGYFVGKVMKNMNGRGNPKIINDLLKELLD